MAPGGRASDAEQLRSGNQSKDVGSILSRTKSKQRDPPPALFLHPSPTASHVSLPGILAPGASISGPSGLRKERSNLEHNKSLRHEVAVSSDGQRSSRGFIRSTRNTDRTEALWAEMQATLEEVGLSASKGTHVFGPEHDEKLAELRNAQVALAQAWARSEAEDVIETTLRDKATPAVGVDPHNMRSGFVNSSNSVMGDDTDGEKSTAASTNARPRSSVGISEQLGGKLEEETEVDILLARKRREANDKYFQRVNNGVVDVVVKLKEVAEVMRSVERETRDVWSENASATGSSRV